MLQAWATGSGRQVYCYQAGIIQKQHKKLDASIKKSGQVQTHQQELSISPCLYYSATHQQAEI